MDGLVNRQWVRQLLEADSVAIVGATERRHHTRAVVEHLTNFGMDPARIGLVNPNRSLVEGLPCVPSLRDLAFRPSLVLSLLPPQYVATVMEEAAEVRATALVSITEGFADAGPEGRRLQEHIRDLARELDMAVLGPNTLGYFAPRVGAWVGDWTGWNLPTLRSGGISIVAQSSGMLNLILQLAARQRIGIRAAISVGNEACLDAGDFVDAFASDEETGIIALVLESASAPRKLTEALRVARGNQKDVVVLKFGSSEIGQANALSHSGRLATSGRVWTALFDKLGIAPTSDFDEFLAGLAIADAMRAGKFDGAGDLAFLTNSGGDAGLIGDICEEVGLRLAPLSAASREKLAVVGDHHATTTNPVDLGSFGQDYGIRGQVFEAAIGDPGVGYSVVRLALPWHFSDRVAGLYDFATGSVERYGKPTLIMSRAAEPLDGAWFEHFAKAGMPLITAYGPGLRALRSVVDKHRNPGYANEWNTSAIPEWVSNPSRVRLLSWHETQEWLSDAHVPYAANGLASSAEEAVAIASSIGFPVCVKGVIQGVVHKSHAGLVVLGLSSPQDVADAVTAIATCGARLGTDADMRYEVQAMVATDVELIVGMVRDPILGPVMTIGTGGTDVEELSDVTCFLPPVTEIELQSALGRLHIGSVLHDLERIHEGTLTDLSSFIVRFGNFIASSGDQLLQADLNPIAVSRASGVVAVDAIVSVSA